MDQSAIKELTLQAAVRFASEVRKYGSLITAGRLTEL